VCACRLIIRNCLIRENDHPGNVFPGKWPSGNRLSGKRPIRENDYPGNDFPGNVFPGKKPSGKVTIRETTVNRLDESRRVWTIYRQRSRVASCRRCERTSRQSWPSFQFSPTVTYTLQNCKLGQDSRRARTHRRHNSTRLNSTVESRRRWRCVLGISKSCLGRIVIKSLMCSNMGVCSICGRGY